MKWEKKKLGELCFIGRGSSPRPIANPAYFIEGTIPWIKIADATSSVKFIFDTKEHVNEYGASFSRKLQPGSLILAASGTLGFPMFLGVEGCIHDGWLYFDDLQEIDKYFLYYKLITFREYFNGRASGAAIQNINTGILKELEINIPPLPAQRKIASILSAYDDLIENNLKRIKLLEEQAFLKYKIIVNTEAMLSESKLDDIIQVVKRKPKIPKSNYNEVGEYPIIDQSTDFIGGYTDEKESIYNDFPIIIFGDHTRILKYINFPFACGADGTQLITPKNKNTSVAYLYFELISCNLSNYHYARHFKFLKEQIIKLPSEKVMLEYQTETNNMFQLIDMLRILNNKLREARDILLPKLMNGQIEV